MNNQSDNNPNKTFNLETLSFFNSDSYFNFVHKKSERLCMAIYLITDFFPNHDPIKDNMRRGGTDLLNTSLSLITSSSSFRRDILNNISKICIEVISLSKIASNLGMTSIPNHTVLENEIKNFLSVIEERERPSTTGQGFVLNEESINNYTKEDRFNDVFASDVKEAANVSIPKPSSVDVEKEIEVKKPDINFTKDSDHKKQDSNISKDKENSTIPRENKRAADTSDSDIKGMGQESPFKSVMQKNERQQIILGIVRELGETSIKDISDNIKDCSEKTIQRELNTLIYGGVLKKIGERRWSKYVLAE